ncbi:MAG TPA: tetratricopeptide repeat protein, partial [bacterium]|nr:tetratricopeptide repeat protein [bacterium]
AACFFYGFSRTLAGRKKWLAYSAALLCSLAAVFSKENSFTLPLALLLMDLLLLPREKSLPELKFFWPFVAISFLVPLNLWLGSGSKKLSAVVRLAEPSGQISALHYFYTQARVMITYWRLLLIPLRQNIDYDYPIYSSFLHPEVLSGFLCVIVVALIGVLFLRKGKRLASFLIFFYFTALLVESSFLPIQDVIFEHRLYLPMFSYSLGIALVWGWARSRSPAFLSVLALSLLLGSLGFLTWQRNQVWQSNISLWTDAVTKSPLKARPHNSLGQALLAEGRYKEALIELKKTLAISPRYMNALLGCARIYRALGEEKKALEFYEKARRVNAEHPELEYDLAVIASEMGREEDALAILGRLVKKYPGFQRGWRLAGMISLRKGHLAKAATFMERAVRLKPEMLRLIIRSVLFMK